MGDWRAGALRGPLSVLGIAAVILVVAIDQMAKLIVEERLLPGEAIDILPILALYRVHNTGMAFSFFADSGFALMAMTLAATAAIIAFWVRAHDGGWITATVFALMLGGAIGNLIDRVRLGYVIDFLLLHIGERVFFVFNLADVALTLGLLLLAYLVPAKRRGRDEQIAPRR